MDCGRKIIYFTVYENGLKRRAAGYMTIISGGGICDVQIIYRGCTEERECFLQPVYMFFDGSVFLGTEFRVENGEGKSCFRSATDDFVESGRSIAELEAVYLDGVKCGICVGRTDGKEPVEAACAKTEYANPGEEEKTVKHREKNPQGTAAWLWVLLVALLGKNSGKTG